MPSTILSKDIQSLVPTDKIADSYTVKRKLLWGPDGTGNDITTDTPLPISNPSLSSIDEKFVSQISSTSTINRVNSSATSITLLPSNLSRLGAIFFNDSSQDCYVKFGVTASSTSYSIKMGPGSLLILEQDPIYTGQIDALWSAASGAMQVTEFTL